MSEENDPNIVYGGDLDVAPLNKYRSLGDLLIFDLKKGEHRICAINGATNKAWTFHDVLQQSLLMAKILHGSGIKQNDAVAIISENRHEFISISFGTFFLNAVVAPINSMYTERELKHALSLSKPKLIFVSPFASKKVIAACNSFDFVENIVLIEGKKVNNFVISLSDLTKKYENIEFDVEDHARKEVDIKNQDAMIFCSSGTTGLPKGVLTTQLNLMSCLRTYRASLSIVKQIHNMSVIAFSISPWFHVLGFVSIYMYASSYDSIYVYLPKFEEEKFFKLIEVYKVNFLILVPPIMVLLAKSPLFDKYDISSIQNISCGAAALSKELEDKVLTRFKGNVTIRQGYGMSETTYGVLGSVVDLKPGSVGEAVKGVHVKVIDEDGKSLGPNQRGELCFKGDRIMKGYINDPKATSETIDKDGWLHTGDIGYYDEDKQFYIVDRLKELIKYKAFQVAPAEIEGLLLSNPKIKDCGVIGIPDEESGELPFAYVVKQPGVNLTEQEVIDFVAENTSKTKWLRGGVKFINEIPKNPSGKLLRREMRELYKRSKAKL